MIYFLHAEVANLQQIENKKEITSQGILSSKLFFLKKKKLNLKQLLNMSKINESLLSSAKRKLEIKCKLMDYWQRAVTESTSLLLTLDRNSCISLRFPWSSNRAATKLILHFPKKYL